VAEFGRSDADYSEKISRNNVSDNTWEDPAAERTAPCLFVSFPSLKDPAHIPGERQRHTAAGVLSDSLRPRTPIPSLWRLIGLNG
jgi:hypothetical protein